MSAHQPKIAALVAYETGALSDGGRARLESHVAGCKPCHRALGAMRAYDAVVGDARAVPVPEPDWSRMDLALRREARAYRRRAIIQPVAFVLAAAAAAALVFGVLQEQQEQDHERVASGRPAPTLPTERAAVAAEVTLVAGQMALDEVPLTVGDVVDEGSALTTTRLARGHLKLSRETGVVIHEDTTVTLVRLREGEVRLALTRGTLSSEVLPMAAGETYEVQADPWTVRVHGTRFSVARSDGALSVTVDEGVVEVLRAGRTVQFVRAPDTWSSGDGAPQVAQGEVPRPRAIGAAARDWTTLVVPVVPGADLLEVGDEVVPASGGLAMRVPVGELSLRGLRNGREVFRRSVQVPAGGLAVEGEALRPSAPPVRQGHLDPGLIAPVVRAGMRRMTRCQERVARRGPTVTGRFSLRITIGRTGAVQRAALVARGSSGAGPPPAFARCILAEARSWSFPPPTGGIVTFAQPLRFATRR